jgi:RNA polymerase sigma-54 factor
MAFDQRLSLSLKLTQKLIMTPSLQQAIKLLQLNRLELQDVLTQELVENPVLEETANDLPSPSEDSNTTESHEPEGAAAETSVKEDSFSEIDIDSYFQDYLDPAGGSRSFQGMSEVRELPSYENFLQKPPNLTDHLEWQLGVSQADDVLRQAAEAVIGNLNEDGMLMASDEELQTMGNFGEDLVSRAIDLVQTFDPAGVAARNLQECLLLQLKEVDALGTAVETIVREHLDLLQKRRYKEIAAKIDCSLEEVSRYIDIIRHLDPRPGLKYNDVSSQYVVPDIHVVKVDDEYVVVLNEDGLPRLKLSPYYRQMLEKGNENNADTKNYIRDKFRSALWLIKSLEQRQRTIYKVAESVVKHQRAFLDHGIHHMKPLVLRDVAEDIQMHESTVSRVVSNKYMHTPRGVFEMRYFFHSGISSDGGSDVSSLSVKGKIRDHISGENTEKPLSDSAIVKLLKKEGLEIARRTVAKYREEMKIPSSTHRRQLL